ncbi:hypothetical protein D3C76_1851220 [compost metagenome]
MYGDSSFASVTIKLFNAAFAAEYAITPSRPALLSPLIEEVLIILPDLFATIICAALLEHITVPKKFV